MKKKIEGKLTLNRETLRALDRREIAGVAGGAVTEGFICTNTTNTATCETCVGPSCRHGEC